MTAAKAEVNEHRPLRSLYLCYLSLEDPLVQTQVVSYLEGLASRGHTIHLLTFEGRLSHDRRTAIEDDVRARGIAWHFARYHKRPSLPATVSDTLVGAARAIRLVRRHQLDVIHARNHVPAAMGLIAQRVTRRRLIFDVRGLMADEYADAGRWKRTGMAYRLTERIQRSALRRSAGVVMLTEAVRPYLESKSQAAAVVIPCCADVEKIAARARERDAARAEIGATERPVMMYVGKFTGWYMEREMAAFYAVARRAQPDLMFLVITQADPAPMVSELARLGIGAEDYRVLRVAPGDIGRYLAAADFGICFIRPCFSKISSSPTKIGEYLSAGLPVVSNAGVGDVEALVGDNRVGVVLREFSEPAYIKASEALRALADEPRLPTRCRQVAHRELSLNEVGVPRYDWLYRRVAEGIAAARPGAVDV